MSADRPKTSPGLGATRARAEMCLAPLNTCTHALHTHPVHEMETQTPP